MTKLDSKFTRVGICSVCEAAPVYIDEHDEYRCSGCQARICKLCFKELNDEHKCNKVDVDEWNLIQADTKACPNCGFRFGHHSRCNSMFCTNCYHGFNYDTLKEIKGSFENAERTEWARRTGVTNNHIVSTFRQLPNDVQTEVVKNVGRYMSLPFGKLVEDIDMLYHYGYNNPVITFNYINDNLIYETEFGKYKDNAISIFLCEVMKEIILDYIIEVLEACEEMNDGQVQVKSIEELIKNEVDLKMNRAAEKLALNIKRLYYYFPVKRVEEIDEIETRLMHSIAKYAAETVGLKNIATLNNVFNVDDCRCMSKGLRHEYKSIERSIAQKEGKPIILKAATSIKDVFEEYKLRFDIQENAEFQIELDGVYRNIVQDKQSYIDDGHVLSLEDVVENRIRSVTGHINGRPFRYADFVGTDVSSIKDNASEEAKQSGDVDNGLIRIILVYFLACYGEEYNEVTLTSIQIYHQHGFRNLRHNDRGYYIIGRRNNVHMLSYSDFTTRTIRYRDYAPTYVELIIGEMRRMQQH